MYLPLLWEYSLIWLDALERLEYPEKKTVLGYNLC